MDRWCYLEFASLDLDIEGPPSVPATAHSTPFLRAFPLPIAGQDGSIFLSHKFNLLCLGFCKAALW